MSSCCSSCTSEDAVHAHYQLLLDRLVPQWRHDTRALERPAGGAAHAAPSSSCSSNKLPAPARPSSIAVDADAAPSSSSDSQQASPQRSAASRSSSPRAGAEAHQLLLLRVQLDAAAKEAKAAREAAAAAEGELHAAAEREAALASELRRANSRGAAAAAAAAEAQAALKAQVSQLQEELAAVNAAHAAELAAAQQQLLAWTATQRAHGASYSATCQAHQHQHTVPARPRSAAPAAKAGSLACTGSRHPAVVASVLGLQPLRPCSAVLSGSGQQQANDRRPLVAWKVCGRASCAQQEYVADLAMAGALLDNSSRNAQHCSSLLAAQAHASAAGGRAVHDSRSRPCSPEARSWLQQPQTACRRPCSAPPVRA